MVPANAPRYDSEPDEPDGPPERSRGWFRRLTAGVGGLGRGPQRPVAVETNPLMEFAEEAVSAPTPGASSVPRRRTRRFAVPVAIAALVGIVGAGSVLVSRMVGVRASTPPTQPGVLSVETLPAGAVILIDNVPRGVTPLTLSLEPGAHTMTVRNDGGERAVPLTVTSGAQIAQYLELKSAAPPAATGLAIVTEPPGARISIDGRARGTAPLTVSDLKAGEYKVTASNDVGSAERTLRVEEGSVASVVFTLPRVAPSVGGWISVRAPFDVDVFENSEVIGTSATTKIMLTAGRHDIVLMNRALEFQEARRIDVAPGSTMTVRIEAPTAVVSANARPWADVVIDGRSVGQTPISNLRVPIGTHEIVFRHPQLGERRQTVTVTANGPNRFAANLAN